MKKQLIRFWLRRWLVLLGLFAAVTGVMFSLLNHKFGFVNEEANWPISLLGIGTLFIGFVMYRCPFCKKMPENDDVPLFNPDKCDSCGKRLR